MQFGWNHPEHSLQRSMTPHLVLYGLLQVQCNSSNGGSTVEFWHTTVVFNSTVGRTHSVPQCLKTQSRMRVGLSSASEGITVSMQWVQYTTRSAPSPLTSIVRRPSDGSHRRFAVIGIAKRPGHADYSFWLKTPSVFVQAAAKVNLSVFRLEKRKRFTASILTIVRRGCTNRHTVYATAAI